LAVEGDASESSLGRVLRKLVKMGWVTRSRGERKELLVKLASS
jgi:DNA-binding MarR family transcriptional regulator